MTQQAPLLAGKYRLIEPLGRGAMGVVWSAINSMTEREVAIKLLANADNEEVRMRLMREARACGRIQHPNVIEIFDVDATENREPFLVMQLLKGETLSMLLQRETTPEISFALRILRDVARGLAAAHKVDVVHRDLKPANVFLHREAEAPEPIVKILDFGVSRISTEETMTLKGLAIGSPAYMAPEQALGQSVDVRTDMWTYGTLTYMVLTGGLPFRGRAPVEYLTAIVKGQIPVLPPVHPAIDAEMRDLVARCFQRDISQRTITATDCAALTDRLFKRVLGQSGSSAGASADVAVERPPPSVTSEAIATAVVKAVPSGPAFVGDTPGPDPDQGAATTNDMVMSGPDDDDTSETLGRIQVPPARAAEPTGPPGQSFHAVRKTVRMNMAEAPAATPAETSGRRAIAKTIPNASEARSPAPNPAGAAPLPVNASPRYAAAALPVVGPVAPVPLQPRRSSLVLWIVLALGIAAGVVLLVVLLTASGSRK